MKISDRFFKHLGEFPNMTRLALFSPECSLCENTLVFQEEEIICRDCLQKLQIAEYHSCKKCGKPIKRNQYLCGDCLLCPPSFTKHISYSFYDDTIKELIVLYKFGEIQELKRILANCLVELYQKRLVQGFDFIIPVPTDSSRKRDFNPILELALWVSKRVKLPLLKKTLYKKRATIPQVGLGYSQRLKNLKGAFSVRNPEMITNKKILLIDDVFTTGTTVKECSKALSKAGASVSSVTLARSFFYE